MDGPDNQTRPYALKAGEGWTYRFGIDFTVKAGEARDGSSAALLEYATRQGEEPEDHTHQSEDEIFYVLEGALTFRCGEETFDLEHGAGRVHLSAARHQARLHNPERDSSPAGCRDLPSQGGVKWVGRFRGRHGVRSG